MDIGCGTGDMLNYLHGVEYVGFDNNQKYIKAAQKKYARRGTFVYESISENALEGHAGFDIVIAKGVMHHLNNDLVIKMLKLAKNKLRENGRLITIDGCFIPSQNWAARLLLSFDRGKYVRSEDGYLNLVSSVFPIFRHTIRQNQLRLPYTHIVIECFKV